MELDQLEMELLMANVVPRLPNLMLPPVIENGEDLIEFAPEGYNLASPSSDVVTFSQFGSESKQVEFHYDAISGLNECLADQAKKLCIFDLAMKLTHSDHYDIGGIYSKDNARRKSQLWFYCTTSVCPLNNNILNIFVCHRNLGTFTMGISDSSSISKIAIDSEDGVLTYLTLPKKLSWRTYKTCEIDESHHVASYCFTNNDLKLLDKLTLSIPIEINIKPGCVLDKGITMRIKRNHNLSNLFKRNEDTDFTLESTSGRKYVVHKLLLAAHSAVLRDFMKGSESNSLAMSCTDDGMEKFLEYIYTGSVKNILEHDCSQLLEMAEKYKLDNLFKETEYVIGQHITVENAIEIAVLSEQFKMQNIQKKVFEFIKKNSEVLQSDGWKNLSDVALTKKLFKEVYYVDST